MTATGISSLRSVAQIIAYTTCLQFHKLVDNLYLTLACCKLSVPGHTLYRKEGKEVLQDKIINCLLFIPLSGWDKVIYVKEIKDKGNLRSILYSS